MFRGDRSGQRSQREHASGALARSEDALASLSSDKVCCSSPLWSGACPKFQRQTFHEWAACSLPHCGWAKAYYDELRGRGKKHHTAVRALAFKWMRILYRCWKDRRPYSEEVYLASLAKRHVPMQRLLQSVQMP